MRAVVVYESMFGSTRAVAEAIGEGLGPDGVEVVPVGAASDALLDGADLVVVGGPTHLHGMSRPTSRRMAATMAHKPGSTFALEPSAEGRGLREWFAGLGPTDRRAAAFDTRAAGLALFTGRAARVIDRRLRRHGMHPVVRPQSFRVTGDHLATGEQERARAWGAGLRSRLAETGSRTCR